MRYTGISTGPLGPSRPVETRREQELRPGQGVEWSPAKAHASRRTSTLIFWNTLSMPAGDVIESRHQGPDSEAKPQDSESACRRAKVCKLGCATNNRRRGQPAMRTVIAPTARAIPRSDSSLLTNFTRFGALPWFGLK